MAEDHGIRRLHLACLDVPGERATFIVKCDSHDRVLDVLHGTVTNAGQLLSVRGIDEDGCLEFLNGEPDYSTDLLGARVAVGAEVTLSTHPTDVSVKEHRYRYRIEHVEPVEYSGRAARG